MGAAAGQLAAVCITQKVTVMASIFSVLYKSLVAYIARRDNPNGVTAAQLGTETKEVTTASMPAYADKNILPMSFFGDCTDISVLTVSGIANGTTVTVLGDQPCMFAGLDMVMPSETKFDLKDMSTAWQNKTGYLFLVWDGNTLKWTYSTQRGSDSGLAFAVGTITCDASKITSVILNKTFILGTRRMMG